MTESKPTYDAGGPWPTAQGREWAARLRAIYLELDELRNGLPNDGPHNWVFTALGEALSGLEKSERGLLVEYGGEQQE